LALNGFGGPLHQMVEADCIDWLKQNRERFGVIFVDPPTFSNARHRKQTFDVQNDHPALLRMTMRHLAKGGVLIFSTNFRKFKLDPALEQEFDLREISDETVPFDFIRNRRIHRCWEIRHPLTPAERRTEEA
jgi:23S rRNA (guanine2445-N2)-methyltransferase / 23S rRNA (guanine2069-N7)-methyltransferase